MAERLQKAFLALRRKPNDSIDSFLNEVSLHRTEMLREDPEAGMGERFFCAFLLERCDLSHKDRCLINPASRPWVLQWVP